MLIIAHRGGPNAAPENTLAAFRHALALGVDGVELDVQMTLDGALAVIHDETVDRTTSGHGAVRDLTLAELRALDAGQGERVPVFDEVLGAVKSAGAWLLAELKSPYLYPGLEAKLLATVTTAGYLDRTVFLSFDWAALERLRAVNPAAQVGALSGLWQVDLDRAPHAQYVCPMAEMMLLAPGAVRRQAEKGRPTFAWVGAFDRPWLFRAMRWAGVHGLITNTPAQALRVLGPHSR